MLINLRNALMAGKRLPYDAEIEYLESTGTQWIDTGFIPTSGTSVEIGYKTADAQLNTVLFGRRVAYNNKTYCIWANANGKIRFDYALNTTDNKDGPNSIVGSWVGVSKRKERNFVNGIEYTPNETKTFACDGNAYLFGMNNNGTADWLVSAQVAYCRIYENGVLVRDFIPVRRGTVGYLYDRVTRKLFGNAGTGDFTCGPDVVPVEYIESHGTEWIDTGVSPYGRTPIIKLDMMARPTSVEKTGYFGAWGANDSRLQIFRGSNATGSLGVGTYQDVVWRDNVRTVAVLDAQTRSAELYGTAYSNFNISNGFADFNLYLFWRNNNNGDGTLPGRMRCYACEILDASSHLRSFRPVRVGTDATSWEGATMDVLTRRIYRNAGTGAFTYGNDLPYPIPAA